MRLDKVKTKKYKWLSLWCLFICYAWNRTCVFIRNDEANVLLKFKRESKNQRLQYDLHA